MSLIQQATKDCERDDCRITENGGASTCIAWTPVYDKQGNRADRGDPNTHWSALICSTCKREWSVRTQYGETTLTARPLSSDHRQEKK